MGAHAVDQGALLVPKRELNSAIALRIMVVGGIGGMLAGMMMAMVEMLYGAFSSTRSFWDSGMAIWSWVFGQEHFTQNDPGAHVGGSTVNNS